MSTFPDLEMEHAKLLRHPFDLSLALLSSSRCTGTLQEKALRRSKRRTRRKIAKTARRHYKPQSEGYPPEHLRRATRTSGRLC